jgi:hypothetical protein
MVEKSCNFLKNYLKIQQIQVIFSPKKIICWCCWSFFLTKWWKFVQKKVGMNSNWVDVLFHLITYLVFFFFVFSQFCDVAHSSYHPQEELVNSRSTVNSSCNPTHKSKTTMVSQVWKSNPIGKCPLSTHHPSSHGVLVAVGSFAGKFTSIITSHWVRASPKVLSMWPCKIIFHIQIIVLFTFLEPRPYYWNSDSK